MGSLAQNEQALEGEVVSSLPAWTRITEPTQLEVGCEYYITWYSNGECHPDGLWSEDNDFLPMPTMKAGNSISLEDLKMVGVPVMSAFGHAVASNTEAQPHLTSVDDRQDKNAFISWIKSNLRQF